MANPALNTHVLNQGEVEGFISNYFGVPPTTPGISDLVRVVLPGVEAAARGNLAGWRSVVPSVLASHMGMVRGPHEGSEIHRQLEIMRHSNRTSAEFAQALGRLQILVASAGGWSHVAAAIESSTRGDRVSSLARTMEMYGGPYADTNLSAEMRQHSMGRFSMHDVASAGNYLHGLGMSHDQIQRYAGYFAGSSQTVRTAIRNYVNSNGRERLTDEHVTNERDASAIMGAIRAGRINQEDAPPSVQRLMEQMQQQGIDPANADAQRIQQFFQNNPQALEQARRANSAAISARTGQTREQVTAEIADAQPPPGTQTPPSAVAGTQSPTPPTTLTQGRTTTLNLGG